MSPDDVCLQCPPISSRPDVSSSLQTTRLQRRLSLLGSVHPATTVEMNTRFILALVFALQVSLSLSEVPAPSQELVDKYEAMKATFYKRLVNAYGKLQGAVSDSDQAQQTRELIESLKDKPELQAFVKVASALGTEAAPMVDRARASLLGLYEQYLRPHVGEGLSNAIDQIKVFLDQHLPAE
ncbi:apolipoprotein A-II isoform X1 [Girardinichthys multiradiatus]|uniref:apolipoprotein A-II isoform X1 n=2 Tax=Girardinichthys multiradiatus TaxID=208333 RepID=UPI001FACC7B0|nr:apolipoprotein A-II isoform X1 [Girardinichthys multiradiatus]